MKEVSDILRDADPVRHERDRGAEQRSRIRQAVVTAVPPAITPSPSRLRTSSAALVVFVLILIAVVAVGYQTWSRGTTTLQAAIRFEVRLAEDQPAAGLREARVALSDRLIYLHEQVIVTNGDIAHSRVVQGNGPARFGVEVEFTGGGAQKMRQATAGHVGRPLAILIDGDVVTAPVLRSHISTTALISGDYSQADAERIAGGIGIR
jgi:hypothetical protein